MLGDASPPVTRCDGVVEPVEEAALDLVGQPAAVRRADGALLGDQHVVGLPDALADGVPVDAGAVEPAQVDHLGVDVADLLDRLEHVVDHRQVGEDRDARCPARRTAALPTGRQ